MKIKVRCCVPGCPNSSNWNILHYLYAVLRARSLKPYVCVKHHQISNDVDMSDYDPVHHDDVDGHRSQVKAFRFCSGNPDGVVISDL